MSETKINISLINAGELSKPADTLIKRIYDAWSGYFKPSQTRRVADAEADAKLTHARAEVASNLIRAEGELQVSEIQQRALGRFVAQEIYYQQNIEEISQKAIPNVNDDAKPDGIENDWLYNFFEKCKIVSDKQMQLIWSRILSGEANIPGSFSKRTVNALASLDASDAQLFSDIGRFSWDNIDRKGIPIIGDYHEDIYNTCNINFESLSHLQSIGLITFVPQGEYVFTDIESDTMVVSYFGRKVKVIFNKERIFPTGKIQLTSVGTELLRLIDAEPVPNFVEYCSEYWHKFDPKNIDVTIDLDS
ncbi:hypothetical protein DGWBC_1360 [Dehalogenimonas sp. WBC-2]|nr:hypothetical protein DGWBC_1360 [Dehalogenimonas sp. WBC-2]